MHAYMPCLFHDLIIIVCVKTEKGIIVFQYLSNYREGEVERAKERESDINVWHGKENVLLILRHIIFSGSWAHQYRYVLGDLFALKTTFHSITTLARPQPILTMGVRGGLVVRGQDERRGGEHRVGVDLRV